MNETEFDQWYQKCKKDCNKNYEGSSGGLEPKAVDNVFKRSVQTHNLQNTGYLGDGDSKSFVRVSKANPPINGPDVEIRKLECCGHVQKRMGKRLTDKTKELKNVQFQYKGENVKGISGNGKGKLSNAKIKALQGYYGAAIRDNAGNVPYMKKQIWATWKHRGGDHSDCGEGCLAKKGHIEAANKNKLNQYVLKAIKPVYDALTKEEITASLHPWRKPQHQ